jgi:hypothetical protein
MSLAKAGEATIHAFARLQHRKAWMAGPSPAMTQSERPRLFYRQMESAPGMTKE